MLIQVQKNDKVWISVMTDASYFRARAQQCLEVANQLSDRQAADQLRKQAAEYRAQAVKLEAGEGASDGFAPAPVREPD